MRSSEIRHGNYKWSLFKYPNSRWLREIESEASDLYLTEFDACYSLFILFSFWLRKWCKNKKNRNMTERKRKTKPREPKIFHLIIAVKKRQQLQFSEPFSIIQSFRSLFKTDFRDFLHLLKVNLVWMDEWTD